MKRLLILLGPNGVGKSTAARHYYETHTGCALVDSDWLRMKRPFSFTDAEIRLVTKNLSAVLENYLACPEVDTVLFTYGLHGPRRQIFEAVLSHLHGTDIPFETRIFILTCGYEENLRRALADGRDESRVRYGLEHTRTLYENAPYPTLDTTELSPAEAARKLEQFLL